MKIAFEHPWFLALLPLMLCFFQCKRENLKIYFAKTELLSRFQIRLTLLPTLTFTLFVLALSTPFLYSSIKLDDRKGRDLVLALDASGSMEETLYDEKSKFEVVKSMAKNFFHRRYDDNIGIVIFGSFAYIAAPLTYDTKALDFLIDYLEPSIAGNNTAIGDGLWQGIEALKADKAKEKVLILITDGHHNSGSISPRQAVERAKKEGIKIYTIGLGDADKNLLKQIATKSGGKFFYAKNEEDLKQIFDELNSLEPSPIRSGSYENKHYLFPYLLFIALFLLGFELYRSFR
ncbi:MULTISPECIES: VWA domain-containing protein [unclassified Nitratiruptor]|uniref:vWA domain-containing protein n=1 Tax=unclassified Nitratiruptor TaxID=2624044 RepID=UPI0019154201|nr:MULTISPECIES: VWA domain-containing protein [unclassified Nitratiruptor]BCD59891.1 Ca-activated chloride channel homolog [Nitratiruptor sp. YY08-10]BCD63814.1 Ca-activated chloride channel homolog [Nitratiruptor sp. YY08-14]